VGEIRYRFTHGAPAAMARRAAEGALRMWSLADCADDVLLVTTELVQNVTQHTRAGGELRLALLTESLLIEVADTDSSLPQIAGRDVRRIGGRGLLLVAAVAVDWGARHALLDGVPGKVVWAVLSVNPASTAWAQDQA